jgi:hypothetical protein
LEVHNDAGEHAPDNVDAVAFRSVFQANQTN